MQIQGLDAHEIAEQFGTPVYVYDGQKIAEQYQRMSAAFSGLPLRIKYAMKALSNQNILKLMRHLGAEIDAVSIGEVELALQAGFAPEEVLFTPNGVTFEEVKTATELGVQINIDNIAILEQFGHEYGGSVPVCIRINPHIMAGGNSKISTGHIDSKFGISILQLRHVHKVVESNGLRVTGLHVHTGSDILNNDVFLEGARIIFEAAMEFPGLEFIDFGSGFKVAYKQGDFTTDLAGLGKRLKAAYQQFCGEYGSRPEIWFEPGKYLVSEAGSLLTRANTLKTTPSTVFVGVDSGLNHLIRPMMYEAYHHIENLSNPKGTRRIYTVTGYICETDTFGYDRKLNEVREGDLLALYNAGAYGFSMTSQYNSRLRPPEVLVWKGQPHLIRRRETPEDLLRLQTNPELFEQKKTEA